MIDKYVVLQEPNKVLPRYYVWQESSYTKIPRKGFVSKVSAEIIADRLNKH